MKNEQRSYELNANEAHIQELLNRFQNGELQVFDEIVKLYTPRLFSVARTITGSLQDAEDVLQEAFMRAYRALYSFRRESRLGTWLCRIVINTAKNRLVKKMRENNFNQDWGEDNDLSKFTDSVFTKNCQSCENILDCRTCYTILLKEIDKLPEYMREVTKLHFLEDLTYAKIALRLDCSEGTVKSRISRARALLKKRLKKYDLQLSGAAGKV